MRISISPSDVVGHKNFMDYGPTFKITVNNVIVSDCCIMADEELGIVYLIRKNQDDSIQVNKVTGNVKYQRIEGIVQIYIPKGDLNENNRN